MLQAFIDDSVADDRVLVMAGFIATAPRWEKFSDEWQSRLDHAGWSIFHMKDVWARGSDEALEHARWHYYTIRDHIKHAVVFVVHLEPLARIAARTGLHALANPYIWGIKGILNMTAQHQTEMGLTGPIDFVFDNRNEKRYVREAWDVYKATVTDDVRAVTGREPIFESDEKVLPLQAADMLAWWCRKRWLETGTLWQDTAFPIPWGSPGEISTMYFEWLEPDIEGEFARVLSFSQRGSGALPS